MILSNIEPLREYMFTLSSRILSTRQTLNTCLVNSSTFGFMVSELSFLDAGSQSNENCGDGGGADKGGPWKAMGLFRVRASQTVREMPWTGGPSPITAIEPLHRDKDPVIRELAETTYKLFKKVAHKLTSSNVKQSCQKMFNFIYIKKLKLLYNYNGTNNLTHSPTGIKESRNDKKRPIYINYEDIWWKNEMFSGALEYNSEEEWFSFPSCSLESICKCFSEGW